jgi:dGTPase
MPDARTVPAILSAIGLAHDLGNPPFGHQGEAAIGHWFTLRGEAVFENNAEKTSDSKLLVPKKLWPEFLEFEGNAQTFRILTRLQVAVGGYGLDLTAATLAALLKYPTSCDKRDKSKASTKKYGYFESEIEIVRWVRSRTGLAEGERHPLTWIMEAADDIAYAVLDIEDAIRKGIVSPDDVRAIVCHSLDDKYGRSKDFLDERFNKTRAGEFSISGMREIMSSYLRTAFIDKLMDEAVEDFKINQKAIESYSMKNPLMSDSSLLICLKKIAQEHVFVSPDVRKIEADGFKIIGKLMDFYWHAIINRKDAENLNSRRTDAKAAYGISKISDNYLQCAARGHWKDRDGSFLPMRYRELRLLTDMVSGMTDGYAKSEYEFLHSNDFI